MSTPFPVPPTKNSSPHCPSPLPLRGCSPTCLTHTPLTSPPCIPLSWGIKSLQNEAHPLLLRPDKAVLGCICARDHRPAHGCYLVGSLVSRSSQGSSGYCCSSCGVAIPFSSFNPSPNSSIGVPDLSPMVSCKYLHLAQSAAGRASQRRAMLGSCLQAQHGISNSIKVDAWPWDGSQFGPVTDLPFLQPLFLFLSLHFF